MMKKINESILKMWAEGILDEILTSSSKEDAINLLFTEALNIYTKAKKEVNTEVINKDKLILH